MGNVTTKNEPERKKYGVSIVCLSDTHGHHNDLKLPKADILIHAGDFTHFGKKKDLISFNNWLGSLYQFEHKIIVNGNHEHNADWKNNAKTLISNGTFIVGEQIEVKGLKIWGTNFHWPCPTGNPYFKHR
eukprot:UN05396